MQEQLPDTQPKNEISLQEIFRMAQDYFWEVVKNWKWLLVFIIPLSAFYLYKAVSAPDKYRAKLTFMVNDENSKSTGYSSFLSNLGLGIGASTEHNLDKILELSKSNLIVHRVLFRWDTINGQPDYLANHMIRAFDYHDEWKGKWLEGLTFSHDSLPAFSRKENAALKALYSGFTGAGGEGGAVQSHYSETSGIMTLEVATPNESLSLSMADVLFNELSEYYIETSIEKSKQTYDRLKEKADSVRAVLESKQVALANFEDRNRGLITQRAAVERQRLQGEVQMLAVMYSETVRNQEVSSFALKNETPFIRAIDRPFPPLWNLKPKWYLLLPRGLAIGAILGIFFVLGRKVYRQILNPEPSR
ncbi:MAG: hypothetical protein GYB31_13085 [Bacteroidetes bacterium]|nr:hypothetical protein [Bacteroidota bacterium]